MLSRLLGGELALSHELLDQRVILRQPRELTVAEQVGAAVADMGDRQVRVVQVSRGERRTHPGPFALGGGKLVDPLICRLHRLREPLLGAPVLRKPLLEGLDRDPRRDLPGLCPAHPVGDDEHRGPGIHRVLVVPALEPGVRLLCRVGGAEHGHCR